jgi:hypothetical protein
MARDIEFGLSRIWDFSCDESDLELPPINMESPDALQAHHPESTPEPPTDFYDKCGSLLRGTLFKPMLPSESFDLCLQCPFINSNGYYNDLAAMNLTSHLPLPSSGVNDIIAPAAPSPAAIVASMAHCDCSRVHFLRGCQVCGDDDDVDMPTTSVPVVQPQHSDTDSYNKERVDGAEQSSDIDVLLYPDEIELSSHLATYERNMGDQTSSLRTDLSQPNDINLRPHLTSSVSHPTNIDFPTARSSKYSHIRFGRIFIDTDILQCLYLMRISLSTHAYQNLFQRKYRLSSTLAPSANQFPLLRLETVFYALNHYRRNMDAATSAYSS